jgi:hypothetical protein
MERFGPESLMNVARDSNGELEIRATELWLYTLLKSRNKNRPSEARRRSRLTDPLRIQILSFGTLETF